MAWWGKLIGGAFGFLMGGPLGALLGGAIGHQFDVGLGKMGRGGGERIGAQERVQTAFFTATFSVMGHLAKADGRVSEAEIALARTVMGQMRLTEAQRRVAMNLFDEGKQPDFPLDEVLEQFRHECHGRSTLIRMFLEIQIQAALADGALHATETALLRRVATGLGFSPRQFEQVLRMIEGAAAWGRAATPAGPTLDDHYKVLGVPRSASDAEVKRAYRRLMSQHHPDKLVAKGLPEEMMKLATERSQEIRRAYERVMEARQRQH